MAPAIRLAREGYRAQPRAGRAVQRASARRFERFESTARYFAPPRPGARRHVRAGRDVPPARPRGRPATASPPGAETGSTGARRRTSSWPRWSAAAGSSRTTISRTTRRRARAGGRARTAGTACISMPPPSSGGVALIQLLAPSSRTTWRELGFNSRPGRPPHGRGLRRAFADRAEWLGDPDFVPVPAEALIDRDLRRASGWRDFNPYRADTEPDGQPTGDPLAYESTETTHYSVVDAERAWPSARRRRSTATSARGVVVDGAGFFLNNEMDDFAAAPGVPNMFGLVRSEANAVAPGKRMLSSMTPAIVEDARGRAVPRDRIAGRRPHHHDRASRPSST